jgi:hypothetical protein
MRSSMASALQATRPDGESVEWARDSHPLAALFVPLERLLLSGGDARLALSPANQLNTYGCRTYPCPEVLAFASSTASTISERGYMRAEHARDSLIAEALDVGIEAAFDARLEAMRHDLKTILGIAGSGAEIVLAPSGTDAQLHALFAARAVLNGPITSIVVGADQTGAGTAFTAAGRHFSDRTALNARVQKDEAIAGLASDIECVRIGMCDDAGEFQDAAVLDTKVENAVAGAIARGRRVIVQAMDRSKLGWRAPSQDCLKTICARWPEAIQVVIDACQARLSATRISAYLERGHIVLLTGSKFFTGPPFSGAMLVPPRVSAALKLANPPPGFRDYSARSDWPKVWSHLRTQLPRQLNFGLWLRWEAALAEIQAYFAVPPQARRAMLERFADGISELIRNSPSLALIPDQPGDLSDRLDDEEMGTRSVFAFLLSRQGRLLSADACETIYRALNRDVSASLPSSAGAQERWLASRVCHIGQPVPLPYSTGVPTAALRVGAGARLVSDCWSADAGDMRDRLEHKIGQVAVTLQKIEMLLAHLPDIDFSKGIP